MKKALFLIVIGLNSLALKAAEDSATLLQTLATLTKILEQSEKALNYQESNTAALAADTWRQLSGASEWRSNDGSLGLSMLGDMSQITFNSGDQTNTVGLNITEAMNAIQNKRDLNFSLSNKILSLHTASIKNDAEIISSLGNASKNPRGQLQALQLILQATIQGMEQQRQARAQMAFDAQWRMNQEKREMEEKRLEKQKEKELIGLDTFKLKPQSEYRSYQ